MSADIIFITTNQNELSKDSDNVCLQAFDAKSGGLMKQYKGQPIGYNSLNIVGLEYIFAIVKDKTIARLWNINKSISCDTKFPTLGKASILKVSPTHHQICIIAIEEIIYVYNLSSGRICGKLTQHYQSISALKFSECGCYFVSGGNDGYVYYWSVADIMDAYEQSLPAKPKFTLGHHFEKIKGVDISYYLGIIGSCSEDGNIKIFSQNHGNLIHNIHTSDKLSYFCFNGLGSMAFLGTATGKIQGFKVYPLDKQDVQIPESTVEAHETPITSMAIAPDGVTLITGCTGGEARLWTVQFALEDILSIGTVTFHPIKSLVNGKGAVTNIIISRLDKHRLNSTDFESTFIINGFDHNPVQNDSPLLELPSNTEMSPEWEAYFEMKSKNVRSKIFSLCKGKNRHNKKNDSNYNHELEQTNNVLRQENNLLFKFIQNNIVSSTSKEQ